MLVSLLALYYLLGLVHFLGAALNAYTLLDIDINMGKLSNLFLSLSVIFPLLLSDLLCLSILGGKSSVDFRIISDYMNAYAAFLFFCVHIHMTSVNLLSQTKLVAKEFYGEMISFLVIKLMAGVIFFCVGIALCSLSYNDYVPFFTVLYYNLISFGNFISSLLFLRKLQELQISGILGILSMSQAALTSRIAKNVTNMDSKIGDDNNNTYRSNRSTESEYKALLIDVYQDFRVCFYNLLIGVLLSVVLLVVFTGSGFVTGLIISIPWKFSVGISVMLGPLPYLHRSSD